MKAFIYLKNGNAKKAEINDVVAVREDKARKVLFISHKIDGQVFESQFDMKVFKTTIYQN